MTPETRQRYVKAIAALVGILPTSEAVPLDEAAFCRDNAVKPSFFLALRDLDCLVLMPSADEATRYRRTDKLLKIEPERIVAQMKASGRPKVEAPMVSGNVKVAFFNPADNVPAEESPKQDEESPKLANDPIREYLTAKALGLVPPPTMSPEEVADSIQCSANSYTVGYEGAEKSCVGCSKGPATYPDLSQTITIDSSAIDWSNIAVGKPLPTNLGYPVFPNVTPTIPMLKSNADLVMYVVDMIVAHCGDEPHDQAGVMVSIQDRLAVQQQVRAQQLQDEAEAMISRSQVYLKTAANIRPAYAND